MKRQACVDMEVYMKKIIRKIAVTLSVSALLITLITGCATLPDFSEKQIAKFQAAAGTPADSVVFYGFLPMNEIVKFKQIDKRFAADEQDGIDLAMTDTSGFWLSTPVEPGSTYMISYMKGSVQGGMKTGPGLVGGQWAQVTTFETIVWDQEFDEDMQYFVIKIPEEPGLYCFGQYLGDNIMKKAQVGEPTQIFDQNNITEMWGKNANQIVVNGLTQLMKAYKGTEWETLALKEIEKYSVKK